MSVYLELSCFSDVKAKRDAGKSLVGPEDINQTRVMLTGHSVGASCTL